MIASGSSSGDIQIWDSKSHSRIGEPLLGHTDIASRLYFSPDSRWLVSGSHDRSIRLWNCQTGQTASSPTRPVCCLCAQIVLGSEDKTIRVWEFNTGEHIGEPIGAGLMLLLFPTMVAL